VEGMDFKWELHTDLDAGKDLASDEIRREVLQNRPDILATLSDYAASQSALELEIAKQYPDVHLGGSYQWDQGENKWALGVTMELPVLNRNEGPIAEAEARRTEAAARFTALQAKVIAEIDRSLTNRLAVQEQLRQIENLVATQRQQLQSIQTAFQAGSADQLEVKSAQLEAGLSELAQLDAQVRWQQSLGQLEDAFQRTFPGLAA